MRTVLVAGGAGFLGSHLCASLLERGDQVICVDDMSTGSRANVSGLMATDRFSLLEADVSHDVPVASPVDAVCHLASPASPPAYLSRPMETLLVGSEGTRMLLELAVKNGARFLLASTSEVYGDPEVHPQPETYRGNVDPTGPRSVYDEAKRFAETLTMAARRSWGANVGIARIFNTYGPGLSPSDGRVVSNFIVQALRTQPLTVYGDGTQTRSLCYVDDLVRGFLALLDSSHLGPVNIGNPDERTVGDLATTVLRLTGSSSTVEYHPLPDQDPRRRCPDTSAALRLLGWRAEVHLETGLARTIRWFRESLAV